MRYWGLALAVLIASPAVASVKEAKADGFWVESSESVPLPPDQVWEVLRTPALWWDADHTYSGDPANMTLEARAGACFCERTADGGTIEHARVVYAQAPRMIRMDGALGPLQAEAVKGTLTFKVDPAEGGSTVTVTYVVGGYMRQGGGELAPLVDRVLSGQLSRLAAALRPGEPAPGTSADATPVEPEAEAEPELEAPRDPSVSPDPVGR